MKTTTQLLKIGTRTSKLAMWQTDHIMDRLQKAWPGLECRIEPFMTQGDATLDKPLPQIGGKGLFTAELEAALRDGRIDIAVHSLKDLPVDDEPGLTLGAITSRAPVGDALIAREGWTLETLPQGAIIGTSSNRRRAQLLAVRPDLQVRSIRGNVQTRAQKVANGDYHATILAEAGIRRMEMGHLVTQWLPLDIMLPAPGQGALAVQCRADDTSTLALLAAIEDEAVRTAVTAERTFLKSLGGGCSAPIAAYARINRRDAENAEGSIYLEALVASTDGKQTVKVVGEGNDPIALGKQLTTQAIAQGADHILAHLQSSILNLQSSLLGKRIVVTRSQEQSQEFADKLAALGADPIVFPVIQFNPLPTDELDAALQQIKQYDWILFTSGNAVDFFFNHLNTNQTETLRTTHYALHIAASGSATARKLSELGIEADFIPGEFVGEKLVEGLGDLTGKRVLLPRAKIGRPRIAELLREQGAEVDDIALYDTITAVPTPQSLADLQQGFDVLTFTSPSSVRNFLKIVDTPDLRGFKSLGGLDCTIACIGPITRDQAQASGLTVHIMPEEYTIDALTEAIVEYFEIKD